MNGILFFLHYFRDDSDEKGTDGCHFVFIHVAGGDNSGLSTQTQILNSLLQIQPTF